MPARRLRPGEAGRYAASGILRERFIPRLLEADDASLATADGSNLDPAACWAVIMSGEKPGGHGERSVACGVLDMAIWDAVAKIEGKSLPPLTRLCHSDEPHSTFSKCINSDGDRASAK